MSTRRARIKAVAALPPRRRNAENADNARNKASTPKEPLEKPIKSPRTPKLNAFKNSDEKNSPSIKSLTRTPPPLLPIALICRTPRGISPKPIHTSPKSQKETEDTVPKAFDVFVSPLAKGVSKANPKFNISIVPHISDDITHTNELPLNPPCSGPNKNDPPYDYNVPSVPDSITDETVMDGIIPLQAANNVPKPIDLLKSEIISEHAEVLFDPIVPLPSPSKVRPKLRPVPRLGPHRRNSIQGSASESEDENRRALLSGVAPTPCPPRQRHDSHTSHTTVTSAVPNRELNRVRNDSVCSTVSQVTAAPPPATSPIKEKHISKARRQEMGKRMWRRRRETVKRDTLTMYDLIFYNPTTNPIVPDQDEVQAKEANAKEEAERNAKTQESEEEADDPPPSAAPVPQIKLGPNGEIMLDEKSLVIKQSDANRKVSSVVREGTWVGSGGGRYTRSARTADWSAAETVRFYRALAAVGTDFSLMAQLFPDRNRKDLKLKFKKEEKLNGGQVDMALRSATSWDVARLQSEFSAEREDAAKRAENERRQLVEDKRMERERVRAARELRIRNSKAAKAVEASSEPAAFSKEMTAEDFAIKAVETRLQAQKRRKNTTQLNVPKPKPTKTAIPLVPPHVPTGPYATLTLVGKQNQNQSNKTNSEMATISKIDQKPIPMLPTNLNSMNVPPNIESGSLVVLRVNDPASPLKTMLQTYIAHGNGKLTPIALPSTFLNSVVGYMKLGTPKGGLSVSNTSSPQLTSPSSIASQDSRNTPSVIQLNPNPSKRKRHSSYTITPL